MSARNVLLRSNTCLRCYQIELGIIILWVVSYILYKNLYKLRNRRVLLWVEKTLFLHALYILQRKSLQRRLYNVWRQT